MTKKKANPDSSMIVLQKTKLGKIVVMAVLSVILILLGLFILDVGITYVLAGLFVTPLVFAYVLTKIIFWRGKSD